jgi:hypothetical protein
MTPPMFALPGALAPVRGEARAELSRYYQPCRGPVFRNVPPNGRLILS